MAEQSESDYFAERAIVEHGLTGVSTDSNAAAAHAELAERYETLAEVFKSDDATSKIAYKLATTAPLESGRSD